MAVRIRMAGDDFEVMANLPHSRAVEVWEQAMKDREPFVIDNPHGGTVALHPDHAMAIEEV